MNATVERNRLVQDSTRGNSINRPLEYRTAALARRLRNQSWSLRVIAKQDICGHSLIDIMLRGQPRDIRPIEWIPQLGALSIQECEEILRGLSRRDSLGTIVGQLGRYTSTISIEVGSNTGRDS